MRSKVVRTLTLALMLGGISIAMGQQNPQGVDEKQKDIRGKEEADRAKHIALLKNKGELDWPESLKSSAFKDSREMLNALMQRAYKSLDSGNKPDAATLNDLQVQWRKLRDILNKMVSELKPEEFIEATRYVQEIHQTIMALQDPNIGYQFRNAHKGPMAKVAPSEKSKLEEMLAEALKNNPDIRVAAAKLAEVEAELNRTRLQVTQKVVTLYYVIETQKKIVEQAEKRDKRGQELGSSISSEDKDELRQSLALAKSKLAELEAQMPALLGKSAHSEANADAERISAAFALRLVSQPQDALLLNDSLLLRLSANQHKAMGPMAERLRKALQTPIKVDYKEMTIELILKDLAKKVEGLSFRNHYQTAPAQKYSLRFEEALPISAILQALSDESECLFFVREYGILATPKIGAPRGAMTVEDFLRHKPADESRPQSRGGKNPPAENVEGLVKNVDFSGLMTLTIGSDAGLTKGHTLELFRLNPSAPSQSKYLGTVRVLEAEAQQSVAQAIGRLAAPAQRGDRVARRLLGN